MSEQRGLNPGQTVNQIIERFKILYELGPAAFGKELLEGNSNFTDNTEISQSIVASEIKALRELYLNSPKIVPKNNILPFSGKLILVGNQKD